MASPNVEHGLEYLFEAFNRHDLDKMMAGYSDEICFTTGRGSVRGKAAVREMFAGFFARSPQITAHVERYADAGSVVVYEFWLRNSDPEGDAVMHCDVVHFGPDGLVIAEDNYSNRV